MLAGVEEAVYEAAEGGGVGEAEGEGRGVRDVGEEDGGEEGGGEEGVREGKASGVEACEGDGEGARVREGGGRGKKECFELGEGSGAAPGGLAGVVGAHGCGVWWGGERRGSRVWKLGLRENFDGPCAPGATFHKRVN